MQIIEIADGIAGRFDFLVLRGGCTETADRIFSEMIRKQILLPCIVAAIKNVGRVFHLTYLDITVLNRVYKRVLADRQP